MNTLSCHYLKLKESFDSTLKSEQFFVSLPFPVESREHKKTMWNNDLYAICCNREEYYSYKVIRPFLNISRNDITIACQHEKIPVYPDKSNQNLKYSRNRIRKQIIPSIQLFFNPLTEDALFQFAEFISQEQSFVSGLLNKTLLE